MATYPRPQDDLEMETRTDAQQKETTADELRMRRAPEPPVIPAPQEPMNAPAVEPEVRDLHAVRQRGEHRVIVGKAVREERDSVTAMNDAARIGGVLQAVSG